MYTMVMNLLNFTAGILTVDRETEEDQAALENYPTPCAELQWIKEVRSSTDQAREWMGRPGWGTLGTIR